MGMFVHEDSDERYYVDEFARGDPEELECLVSKFGAPDDPEPMRSHTPSKFGPYDELIEDAKISKFGTAKK